MKFATLARTALVSLVVVAAAHAASPAIPASKVSKIADAAIARSAKIVVAADAQIDKLAAKNMDAKALAAAERARAQLQTNAAKAHVTIDKSRDAFEAKYAAEENAAQIMLALNFAASRADAAVDQHLAQCLADIDESLTENGISP